MTNETLSKTYSYIAAVVVLSLVLLLLSGKKKNRYRHFITVVLSVVYGIGAGIVCVMYSDQLAEQFAAGGFLPEVPVIAANLVILAGFIPIKALVLIFSSQTDGEHVPGSFYEYDAESDGWLLKAAWINYRGIAIGAAIAALVGTCGAVAAMSILAHEYDAALNLYPAAAMLIIGEFACFLNGNYDRQKIANRISGNDSSAISIKRYFKLRDVLEKLFPAELLNGYVGSEFFHHSGATNYLRELEKADDRIDRLVAAYFKPMLTTRKLLVDSISAVRSMMHGKSVILTNPFYRDNSEYIALPLINALISNKKCLIIAGQNSIADDAVAWAGEMIQNYCKLHSLWSVEKMGEKVCFADVGVLPPSEIYNLNMLELNREFFKEVEFVVLLEPSLLLVAGQVGLGIVSEEIKGGEGKVIYCVCDRKADGLVDTLSHLLKTELVEVSAAPVPHNTYAAMLWDANGDYARQRIFGKQVKYLGGGVELAAVAIKNQIPETIWYSETKAPVKDIRWIAGQNYTSICRYMNQPVEQKSIDDKMKFVSSLWSAPPEKDQFIIVDDEFCNMFNMMSIYLSRASNQLFINVMSENYLLRDYMRYNRQLFANSPNAVPSLVSAYSKTERNVVMSLVLKMAYRQITETEIKNELLLVGVETRDVFPTLTSLISRYTPADDTLLTTKSMLNTRDLAVDSYDVFSISPAAFSRFFGNTLKNAYYLIEDEVGNTECIDAKLYCHITQSLLPGQFVCYDGKYYEVKRISPAAGVILRRASAVYDGRMYYRQLRTYTFEKNTGNEIANAYSYGEVEIATIRANFRVSTSGYLILKDNHDLAHAKMVDFSGDPICRDFDRAYKCKNVLRLKLPGLEETDRYVFCVLLSELLRSIFPNAVEYLAVLTARQDDFEGMLKYLLYRVEGEIESDYIYIVEDSTLDLGLIEAIERNLKGIFEILTDYLDWHSGKIRESAYKDPDNKYKNLPKVEKEELERQKERANWFKAFVKRIGIIFGNKSGGAGVEVPAGKGDTPQGQSPTEEAGGSDASGSSDEALAGNPKATLPEDGFEPPDAAFIQAAAASGSDAKGGDNADGDPAGGETQGKAEADKGETGGETQGKAEADKGEADGETQGEAEADKGEAKLAVFASAGESAEIDDFWNEQFEAAGIINLHKSRYQRECFLKFGFDEIDPIFDFTNVVGFLHSRGYADSAIKKARKRNPFEAELEALGNETVNHCDFCGVPLNGVSFDRLDDGRVRCNDCGTSAITSVEEFKSLYNSTLQLMCGLFDISYNVPLSIVTADAATIAKARHAVFAPSTGVAPRILGYARRRGNNFSLVIENGSPRLASIDTIVHEMTHIWQYLHWDQQEIQRMYGENTLLVYEGMAVWAAVQFLYLIGEHFYAAIMEAENYRRQDEYGEGFRYYCSQYPLVKDGGSLHKTPFNSYPPLE